MKKLMLLVNPASGKSAMGDKMIDIIDIFIKGGYTVDTVISQSVEHLKETVVPRSSEFDTLVCCGGDGTLNMTISAMMDMENKPCLGYIPCGTTNDFANTRGIPVDPIKAARQIVNGDVHEIDVGKFGDKYYIYVAAFGIFSDVSYSTSRKLKKAIGHAAYLVSGIKSFVKIKKFPIKYTCNGETHEDEFIYGMFSNTKRVGGFKLPMFKNYVLDDGKIDIMLVKRTKNVKNKSKLVGDLIVQKADGDVIFQLNSDSFTYESEVEIPWTLDGEYGGSFKSQTIQIIPACIKMLY